MGHCRITRAWRAAATLSLALILSACSTAGTRVTLMPDQSGSVGSVVVGNTHGQQAVSQAYASVQAGAKGAPTVVAAGQRELFENTHRALIAAQPSAPRSFVLYFEFDSMVLTAESRARLPEVFQAVRDRAPTEVTVYGYTDSVGTAAYNLDLSAQRARAVGSLLRKLDPQLGVAEEYFGDKAPLVPTRRGVPEPRNRRAEVIVL